MLARVLLCMVVGFLLACGGDTHRGGGTFGGGVSGVWWVWVGGGGDDEHSVVLFQSFGILRVCIGFL